MAPTARRTARHAALAAAALVALAPLAACSSDDGGSTSTTTAGATSSSMTGTEGTTPGTNLATPGSTAPGTPTSSVAPGDPTTTTGGSGGGEDAAPLDPAAPYGVTTGQACIGATVAQGEPIPVTLRGSLDGAPDGQLAVRLLEGDDFLDLLGTSTGGTFVVAGAVPTPGEKEVVEAFIVTPSNETIDVTLSMQEFVGGTLTVATTPGIVAGSGSCEGA